MNNVGSGRTASAWLLTGCGVWLVGLSGLLTVAVMSAVNFTLGSDFRWMLLVPALAWLGALVLHRAGR